MIATDSVSCPVCGSAVTRPPIVEVDSTPVNSVVILDDAEEALGFTCGTIELAYCDTCGFAWNATFDEALVHYEKGYESTQAFSNVFNRYHEKLADQVVADLGLEGATVVEIGCGQGEFLHLLSERGVAKCIGFDPAFDADREGTRSSTGVEVVATTFQAAVGLPPAPDLVCCKMTLEHIPLVTRFLSEIRARITSDETTVLFQVPNFTKILDDGAFWDVYYEHCSYFTEHSLRAAFSLAGFVVDRTWNEYDEQYLFAEAHASNATSDDWRSVDRVAEIGLVDDFATRTKHEVQHWRELVGSCSGSVVLWGGGSKAVAFLAALGSRADAVVAAVDVNPLKHDTFLPGSGLPVIGPEDLRSMAPELVVLMNPIYTGEVSDMLNDVGCGAARLAGLGQALVT